MKKKAIEILNRLILIESLLFLIMSKHFTCHVLILAPFKVPLKLQFFTYTSSTVADALFAPKLPTLYEP